MHSGSVEAIHIEAKIKANLYDPGATITMPKGNAMSWVSVQGSLSALSFRKQ
jgi:hypothetical protein